MSEVLVLDAAAFDTLVGGATEMTRALFRRITGRGGEVRCAAVTLAEVCRGSARTRQVEAALARRDDGQRIRMIPTDERLAKLVGSVLYASRSGSERLADAHVVAICADADVAVVLTSDPDDIVALSAAVPGIRIVVRRPA
jgi:predicted nucleic acid-binding protein